MRDLLFKKKQFKFAFNNEVVKVFSDMIKRSVPGYELTQGIINYLIPYFNVERLLDLGCSNGLLIKYLAETHKKIDYIGIDSSYPMILNAIKNNCTGTYLHEDLIKMKDFPKNDFTILNYTLQFIDPKCRLNIIKKIYRSLDKFGAFIISEKLKAKDSRLEEIIDKNYLNYKKRNGYSNLEIYRKKESLENVLISFTSNELEKILKLAKFRYEPIFRYYNFTTYLCLKS